MGVISQLGLTYETYINYSEDYHYLLLFVLIVFSIVFVLVGLMLNDFKMENYKKILSKSGLAITNFTREDSYGITLINIGLTSLLVIVIIIVLNIKISGPIMGVIMVVIGFSAFGKHIRNVLPSMLGVYIMSLIFGYHASNITISLAIIFSTALAPLSGEKGVVVGILAGMVHLPLVLNFSNLLGGALLYANGFAAGIINNLLGAFERGNNEWHFMKRSKVQK